MRGAEATLKMTPKDLRTHMKELELGPVAMSRAMGVPYDTFRNWLSGRREMPPVAERCIELLLEDPEKARKLSNLR